MSAAVLDIFKKRSHKTPFWLDAVGDLGTARLRLRQLASVIPGESFAFDRRITANLCQRSFTRFEST